MSPSRGDRDFVAWAEKHAVPDECQFCGNSTDWHPSVTCLEHRDLAIPIPGLDAPYADDLHSSADGERS